MPAYAELHCLSNFSFLRGASHPEELVERAHSIPLSRLRERGGGEGRF
jgi:error-prone DNA polymerase